MADRLDIARLVDRHQAMLWRYLRLLGCNGVLAEDMVQETFLYVIRKASGGQPFDDVDDRATAAYLRQVARHKFIDEARRSSRARLSAELDAADAVWSEHYPDDEGTERLTALAHCMEALTPKARKTLQLHYREGQQLAVIARAMSGSEGAIKMALLRAREALRDCMEKKLRKLVR